MQTNTTDPETDRTPPADAPDDPAVCAHCGEPFVDAELVALHCGLEHEGELSEDEREAYRNARTAEREALRLFRLKALAGLVAIYFGFIFVYAFIV